MMNERIANRLLHWDIDWGSWLLALFMVVVIPLGAYRLGLFCVAIVSVTNFVICIAMMRPAFLVRRCCPPWSSRLAAERVVLRVSAKLHELVPGRIFPRKSGGWLYLTTERLVFQSRKHTVDIPFASVRNITSQPPSTRWWMGIYVNARGLFIHTHKCTIPIGVRYPHLIKDKIEQQMRENAAKGNHS